MSEYVDRARRHEENINTNLALLRSCSNLRSQYARQADMMKKAVDAMRASLEEISISSQICLEAAEEKSRKH